MTTKENEVFEKTVTISAAFDERHTDPAKNYGIGSGLLRFVLKGERGATQFTVYTGWHLPETDTKNKDPYPADLGYHSPTPHYEGQPKMESCDVLGDGGCYYDGSTLNAGPVFEVLLREGSDGVWRVLEEHYCELFGAQAEAVAE